MWSSGASLELKLVDGEKGSRTGRLLNLSFVQPEHGAWVNDCSFGMVDHAV